MKLHLHFRSRKKSNKTYRYYSIASSYRKDGKNLKNEFRYLGTLSDEEAQDYKLKLKVVNEDVSKLVSIDDIRFVDDKRYLDVALINQIYDRLKINEVFYKESKKEVGTAEVAKILTLARCLDPQANYKTVEWFKKTYLPEVMVMEEDKYNNLKLFHELENISKMRGRLQKHFFELSKQYHEGGLFIYFLDATTSYFEGSCCEMAEPAMDKTAGYQDKVIMIFLVTDAKGYPIVWDEFSGRKREVKEFKQIADTMTNQLGIEDVTLCFDRGMTSDNNFETIERQLHSKYITGLDRDQIATVFDLVLFSEKTRELLIKRFKEEKKEDRIIPVHGFYRSGKDRFYKELGVIEGRRYVVSFNYQIYEKQTLTRLQLIDDVKHKIEEMNDELTQAKKDRDDEVVQKKLQDLLTKYKLNKIIEYTIVPAAVSHKNKTIQSYRIDCLINREALTEQQRVDGVLVYVTNHTEKKETDFFKLPASHIVMHYKNKYIIEHAFRHIKSFLEIRPFFVYLKAHVRAHVDICMIAYFINTYVYQQLKKTKMSFGNFYSQIKNHATVCKLQTGSETNGIRSYLKKPNKEVTAILKALNAQALVSKNNLEKLNIMN